MSTDVISSLTSSVMVSVPVLIHKAQMVHVVQSSFLVVGLVCVVLQLLGGESFYTVVMHIGIPYSTVWVASHLKHAP